MITRLPGWVWVGGGLLAGIAGMVDAVGMLSFQHLGVSHLSGNSTLLGISIADGNGVEVLHIAAVVIAFVAGATLSGFVIQDSTLRLGRRYGVALLLESALLFAAAILLGRQHLPGELAASAACGLQNAMASTYSGAVFRTTHVTGTFTDLGIYLGQRLRRISQDVRHLYLALLLTGAFILGGAVGARCFVSIGFLTLVVPAVLTGCAGLLYGGYAMYRQRMDMPPR